MTKRFFAFAAFIFAWQVVAAQTMEDQPGGAEFRPQLGVRAVAGKIGVLYLTDDYGFTPAFGIWAELGSLAKNLDLDGGLEYWNGGKTEAGGIIHKIDIAFYLTVKLVFEIDKWRPFLGVGLGVNMYTKKYPEDWEGRPDEKNTNLEPHIDMGVKYPVHPKIDVEARLKVNPSDVSAYGMHISALFKMGE